MSSSPGISRKSGQESQNCERLLVRDGGVNAPSVSLGAYSSALLEAPLMMSALPFLQAVGWIVATNQPCPAPGPGHWHT